MKDELFGLKSRDIEKIQNILAHYPEIEKVIIYGSRAKGNYKVGSDIDLTVIGNLEFRILMKLENDLEELLLPYKMDISVFHKINNPDLIEHIKKFGKVFYQKTII